MNDIRFVCWVPFERKMNYAGIITTSETASFVIKRAYQLGWVLNEFVQNYRQCLAGNPAYSHFNLLDAGKSIVRRRRKEHRGYDRLSYSRWPVWAKRREGRQ